MAKIDDTLARLEEALVNLESTVDKLNQSVGAVSHNFNGGNGENKNLYGYRRKKYNKEQKNVISNIPGAKAAINEIENIQNQMQNRRLRRQVEFDVKHRKEIIDIERYRDEVEGKRYEAQRKREQDEEKRKIKLYDKTHDEKGRLKGNAEFLNLLEEKKKAIGEMSTGRKIGEALKFGTNAIAGAASYVNNGKMDVGGMADKLSSKLMQSGNPYAAAAGSVIQMLKTAFEMYSKVNTAASKFSRTVGGGSEAIKTMETRMASVAHDLSVGDGGFFSVKWGRRVYDAAELIESMAEYSETIGRNTQNMSKSEIRNLQDLKEYGISGDTVNQFHTLGVSLENVSERMVKLYGKAGRHGLNAKKTTDTVVKNLKLAQTYTFQGGVKAIERMAEKSVSLKYNLESVARFADKVSTLEGAAQSAAGLSVLGGSFAQVGNPLALYYGGLQDPEKLNDMMINMTKNLAYWDSNKEQMDLSAYNRIRLKQAAEHMGVNFDDLYNMAMNQGKNNIIDTDIHKSGNDMSWIDKDTKQFIQNIAEIKDGKAWVNIKNGKKDSNGMDQYETKAVSSLTSADLAAIKAESESKDMKEGATIGDLLQSTKSTQEKLDEILKQIKEKLVYGVMSLVSWFTTDKKNKHSIKYGFNNEEDKIYKNLKNRLDAVKHVGNTWGESNDLEKAILVEMGVFNEKGEYTGQAKKDGQNQYYTWAQTAEMLNKFYKENPDFIKNFNEQQNATQKKAYGGIIRGKGTSTSDSIPAMLSNGEFVMNAKATSKHLSELSAWNSAERLSSGSDVPIRNGKNSLNSLSVSPVGIQGMQPQTMRIDPISINLSGSITLQGNGSTKDISVDDLLNDNVFVSRLIREIERSTKYALDKRDVHMKYPI